MKFDGCQSLWIVTCRIEHLDTNFNPCKRNTWLIVVLRGKYPFFGSAEVCGFSLALFCWYVL